MLTENLLLERWRKLEFDFVFLLFFRMNDDSTEAKSTNVDAEILERIREILNKNNCQSGQSQGIVNLFRRLLSLPENEQTEDGNYHEIIPRLFLGDL